MWLAENAVIYNDELGGRFAFFCKENNLHTRMQLSRIKEIANSKVKQDCIHPKEWIK